MRINASKYKTLPTDLIIVKAKLHVKPPEAGGRKTGIISGYRPNHVFELPKGSETFNAYVGDIQFDDREIIQPGETKIVTVRFLRNPVIEQYIKVGQKWYIYEVPKLVAEGEIIEV